METEWRQILWQQFGASIEMLENGVRACTDELWSERSQKPQFWYLVYHTLFFLDLYLSESREGFAPPAPFALDELNPAAVMPERTYTKEELLDYLEHGRRKCRSVIESLTRESLLEPRNFGWVEGTLLEMLLYNMRHVQHHAAQLNLLLREKTGAAPGWVSKAGS